MKQNSLKGCFTYLDDIIIVEINQSEHDINLKAFFDATSVAKITVNEPKTQLLLTKISLLGFLLLGYFRYREISLLGYDIFNPILTEYNLCSIRHSLEVPGSYSV